MDLMRVGRQRGAHALQEAVEQVVNRVLLHECSDALAVGTRRRHRQREQQNQPTLSRELGS
eukprot:1339621-Prymnesium_polylepis.1